MSLPRVRFPVRQMMVAVSIVANASRSAAPAQDVPPVLTTDQALDAITQKSAAVRLVASAGPSTPVDMKVPGLIDRLLSPDRNQVQAAVTALSMLGPVAAPSLIRRIDDRRDMAVHGIAFENRSPGAFESVAQYGVAKVVDCLNLILTGLTGENHGFLDISMDFDFKDQRAADAERGRIVRGWRQYLTRLQSSPRPPSKSLPAAMPAREIHRESDSGEL